MGSQKRPISEIAAEIESDWQVINNQGARKALDYMKTMGSIEAPFVLDESGYGVIGSFLQHAIGWKGQVARRIKKELRVMCGHPRP
jgi:hypothetical protein